MAAVAALDGETLQRGFGQVLASVGVVPFLEDWAGPFLVRVGDAWASGRIQTFHEHFASEQLRDFLAAGWRPLAAQARGPVVVCATLPGEAHALGLQMVAAVLALEGCRIVFVGPDTPLADLRQGVVQAGARALFVSLSSCADPMAAGAALTELRWGLPAGVAMVIGGAGAPDTVPGVQRLPRLSDIPGVVATLEP
jgi:methanogenic corrinoid protein MtbC1